jgi:hypothetical protein
MASSPSSAVCKGVPAEIGDLVTAALRQGRSAALAKL